jgi:hypothetical protein
VGIFHGGEALADMDNTKAANLTDGEALWNTAANFNLAVLDLPRMARLCFALYTSFDKKMPKGASGKTVKVKDGKQKHVPIFCMFLLQIHVVQTYTDLYRIYRSEKKFQKFFPSKISPKLKITFCDEKLRNFY